MTVGVHPSHAREFDDAHHSQLERLVNSPDVAALGEIGVDCIEGAKAFELQLGTLRWAVGLCLPYKPLVLHCRASGGSSQASAVLYRRLLGVVQEKVLKRLQGIHLHTFTVDTATVILWLESYPETYFGFYLLAKRCDEGQRQGIRAVPEDRLLLETDSPHLADAAASINHPAHLFRVAEVVAEARSAQARDILAAGVANGRALYLRP